MEKNWIKTGNTVYVDSLNGWALRSGNATIEKVGRKYFYLKECYGVKVDMHTLFGSYTDYGNVCKIYPSKEAFEKAEDMKHKRRFVEKNIRFLTDEEIGEVYNTIIQRNKKA